MSNSFNLVYADPPWGFDSGRTGGSMTSHAANVYPTMTDAAIAALPVWKLTDTDALLALWVPTSKKDVGLRVMDAWGFRYKTTVYWVKVYGGRRMGMGHWMRGGVEELLIGLRGHVRPWRIQRPGHVAENVLRHSEKPHAFRQLVYNGTMNKLPRPLSAVELFARRRYKNWTPIGNAIDGQDIAQVIRRWSR